MTTPYNLTVEEIQENKDDYVLVDVREPDELKGPEGYMEGAILATFGPRLSLFLKSADSHATYLFICRSGFRSSHACELARACGLRAYNMQGGMLAWQERLNL